MSNPVGRPAKQVGGITLAKTRMFQRCFSEEDIQGLAQQFKDRMTAPDTTNGDFAKLWTAWSRFVMLSADVEAQVKAEVKKALTPERQMDIIEMVRNGMVFEKKEEE